MNSILLPIILTECAVLEFQRIFRYIGQTIHDRGVKSHVLNEEIPLNVKFTLLDCKEDTTLIGFVPNEDGVSDADISGHRMEAATFISNVANHFYLVYHHLRVLGEYGGAFNGNVVFKVDNALVSPTENVHVRTID